MAIIDIEKHYGSFRGPAAADRRAAPRRKTSRAKPDPAQIAKWDSAYRAADAGSLGARPVNPKPPAAKPPTRIAPPVKGGNRVAGNTGPSVVKPAAAKGAKPSKPSANSANESWKHADAGSLGLSLRDQGQLHADAGSLGVTPGVDPAKSERTDHSQLYADAGSLGVTVRDEAWQSADAGSLGVTPGQNQAWDRAAPDRWISEADWLTEAIEPGGRRGTVDVPGMGPVPLHVPRSTYVNGFTDDHRPASYSTNWHLEEDDWETVSIVRSVSQIPTVDSSTRWAAAFAGLGNFSMLATLPRTDYYGAILLPDGTLGQTGEDAGPLFQRPQSPTTPLLDPAAMQDLFPEDPSYSGKPDPNMTEAPSGSNRSYPNPPPRAGRGPLHGPYPDPKPGPAPEIRRPIGAWRYRNSEKSKGAAFGIRLAASSIDTQVTLGHRNYFQTQTLLQRNGDGDTRAVVIATQIQQAGPFSTTGEPEVNSWYLWTTGDGDLMRVKVEVPVEFRPATFRERGKYQAGPNRRPAIYPPSEIFPEVPRYAAAPYNYTVSANIHPLREPEDAIPASELGFTMPVASDG